MEMLRMIVVNVLPGLQSHRGKIHHSEKGSSNMTIDRLRWYTVLICEFRNQRSRRRSSHALRRDLYFQ
jgi:hypothetical protein